MPAINNKNIFISKEEYYSLLQQVEDLTSERDMLQQKVNEIESNIENGVLTLKHVVDFSIELIPTDGWWDGRVLYKGYRINNIFNCDFSNIDKIVQKVGFNILVKIKELWKQLSPKKQNRFIKLLKSYGFR